MLSRIKNFFSKKPINLQLFNGVSLGDGRKYIVESIDKSEMACYTYRVTYARTDGVGFLIRHYDDKFETEHEAHRIKSINGENI